jgi:K+-sensing histidine kinase KdpD
MLVAGAVLAGALSDAVGRAQRRRSQAEASAVDEHRRLDQEQSLRRRLESVDEAKTDFLRSLAHDFRTPIASLEALAEALDWEQHPLSPAQRTEVIGLIQTHARHLTGMLAEVRDVAVAESLGPGPHSEVADLFVPELIRTAATAAGLAPERLVSSVEPGLTLLRTDTRKITRILTNLLDNASRHSPPEQPVEVQVSLGRGDHVDISILDRGSGIPPEMATKVFDKFASFGEHRSTGLGMWIVAQFVASLDGEVSLENRPDGGLAVRVRLPAEACLPLGDGGNRLRRSAGDVTV